MIIPTKLKKPSKFLFMKKKKKKTFITILSIDLGDKVLLI